MPKISGSDREILDAPVQLSEIKEATQSMTTGKSPGPDGYPVELSKKFSDHLAPWLWAMFNHSYRQGSLPPTLTQASLSLIFKTGRDPLDCTSVRPISLLPVDVRILTKALARRLEPIMPSVISEDQTGLIRGRHSLSNVRRLLGVIHTPHSPTEPEVVISLDAEKAFDRVEWADLFSSLQRFGFGAGLITWIRWLHSSPYASVCTNTQRSESFPLSHGTRQGCPLPPLLFTVAIEPLSIALKTEKGIKGIQRWGTDHKVSLYADDLLSYARDPLTSTPYILSLLESFGALSGYKLNILKSECFAINQLAAELPSSFKPFRFSDTGFKYLGIVITKSIRTLRERNLTTTVRSDLQRWSRLPLSLARRVQAVKMNLLPLYLYIFQSLLTQVFFH